jgi:excisionase family DNA binding protein
MATFEQLPTSVEQLITKVDNLTKLVEKLFAVEPVTEPDEQRFYGDSELAEYLHCNIQTIYRMKKDGKLPYKKYGRKYFYLRSEIDKAFAGKGGRK